MAPDSHPVTCQWTAEDLNDRTVAFVPSRHGLGVRMTGQILAMQVPDGLYIQISLTKPDSKQLFYWLNQDEANRLQKSPAESGFDFILP